MTNPKDIYTTEISSHYNCTSSSVIRELKEKLPDIIYYIKSKFNRYNMTKEQVLDYLEKELTPTGFSPKELRERELFITPLKHTYRLDYYCIPEYRTLVFYVTNLDTKVTVAIEGRIISFVK